MVTVNVNWCSQPVIATLPESVGYCANAKCKSSHVIHTKIKKVIQGKHFCSCLAGTCVQCYLTCRTL